MTSSRINSIEYVMLSMRRNFLSLKTIRFISKNAL